MTQITTKTCTKCKIEKSIIEFQKRKDRKSGFKSYCKRCDADRSSDYARKNRELVNEKSRCYYALNKNEIIKKKSIYATENKEKIYKNKRDRYNENATIRDKKTQYRLKNKIIIVKNKLEYHKKRMANDPVYAMKRRIIYILSNSFRSNGYTKKSRTHEILGCSFEYFKNYFEAQFKDGMSWENRSKWEIDHIIPLASAKTEDDVIRLNHYTNLQPLWAIDNKRKSDKMPPKHIQNKIALAYAKATEEI